MRVGVIGTVGHLNYVLNGIPVLDGVELVAAAAGTPDEDLGRIRAHNAFSDETIFYDDWVTMLDKADLEIVAVCRPYPMNAEATIAALERNIHVVTEKPVATTFDTLNKVEEARAGSSARLTTMFGMRFEPAFRAARKAVEDGRIGEPVLATGQKSYKFGNRPEFFRNRDTYGGSILWVGIHAVDFVRWVSRLDYTLVTALHGNAAHPDYPGCEDHGGILYRFTNGGTAVINLDYLRPEGAPTHGDDRLRIAGTEGIVEVIDAGSRAVLLRGGATEDLPLAESVNLLVDFVGDLRGGPSHLIEPYEATYVTRLALMAREAADRGKILSLPTPPGQSKVFGQ